MKETHRQNDRRGKNKNREYAVVASFFVLLFVGMISYLVYFNAVKSEEFISSPYNTRQDSMADRVIRGDILSADGKVLATTEVLEDGSEVRSYPYGRTYAHVVGYDSNGKSGLESEANFELLSSHQFFLEQLKNEFWGKKNQGDSVVSTLQSSLQEAASLALGDRRGAIVCIEPASGKILAMVSKPDFDPNQIKSLWDSIIADPNDSSLLNRATNGAYPPGSTFKIVTALDYYRSTGSFDGYQFNCAGTITIDDHTIHCYHNTVHGLEDFSASFANSCNCSFAELGIRLGAKSLRQTAEDLLFNKRLPLQTYKSSTFPLTENAVTGLVMQTAIGQGDTLVSPVHMGLIVCAAANRGVLMKPSMVDHVVNASGEKVSGTKTQKYMRMMSEQEASLLRGLMEQVVVSGTASALSGLGYSAAGKTGSAEFDEEGNSHSWFVGYCDTENPKMVVSILVENGGAGSESAVPIAKTLFDTYYANGLDQLSVSEPAVNLESEREYAIDEGYTLPETVDGYSFSPAEEYVYDTNDSEAIYYYEPESDPGQAGYDESYTEVITIPDQGGESTVDEGLNTDFVYEGDGGESYEEDYSRGEDSQEASYEEDTSQESTSEEGGLDYSDESWEVFDTSDSGENWETY